MLFKIPIHNKLYPIALMGCALLFIGQSVQAYQCTTTEISIAQCEALVNLYKSTKGSNWNKKDGWLQEDTLPCNWYGITCADGGVTAIKLPSNNLVGRISNLSVFSSLQTLSLSNNGLLGSIPGLPASLTNIALNGNKLEGFIPSLPANLISLVLNDNNLEGPIPSLPASLTKVGLDNNYTKVGLDNNYLCQDSNADYTEYAEINNSFPVCPNVFLIAKANRTEACIGHDLTVTVKKRLTQKVSAIQFNMTFHSDYFKVKSLKGSGVLEQETQNKIDEVNGVLEFTALQLTSGAISQEFEIATITLIPLKETTGETTGTPLQFDGAQSFSMLHGNKLIQELKGLTIPINKCDGPIIEPKMYSAIWTVIDKTTAIDETTTALKMPNRIIVDATDNIYIADSSNNRVLKRDPQGNITIVAGGKRKFEGDFEGDNGPAVEAKLSNPNGLAIDDKGNLYIADTNNHRIRKVDNNGIITTVVGTGEAGYTGDDEPTSAIAAQLKKPVAILFDNNGHFYITDSGNHRIRKIERQQRDTNELDPNSIITTIAGDGRNGYGGDNGFATEARLGNPSGLAVDNQNNLYIVDTDNHRIRKIDNLAIITTVAGNGEKGYSGDGDPATTAKLNQPRGLAVDGMGNLFIADQSNHRIRKVDNQGIITTFTGTGIRGTATNGMLALVAQIERPTDVALDRYGNLYIGESGLIRRVGKKYGDDEEGTPHCSDPKITGIPTNECYALVALYDSTTGPEWTNSEGWKATDTPCEWFGVTCEGEEDKVEGDTGDTGDTGNTGARKKTRNGSGKDATGETNIVHVIAIDLPNNNLVGSLPSFISALSQLQRLDLSENQISGAVPTTVEHFEKLTELILANNSLIGSLPAEINDIVNLQTLNLAQNKLSGRIPALVSLMQLKILDLSDNRFSGAVPDFTMLHEDLAIEISGNQQLCDYEGLESCPSSNLLPIADFTATPNQGKGPLTVYLNGGLSYDPYGDIKSYLWESSDGQELGISEETPTITFKYSGTYTITLQVTDNDDAPSAKIAQQIIEVGVPDDHAIFQVGKDGTGFGMVRVQRDKETTFVCRESCKEGRQDYPLGSELKLRVKAAKGSEFSGWSGDCVGTEVDTKIKVTVDGTKQCIAVFDLQDTAPPFMHLLTIGARSTGFGSGGSVKVQDILCEEPLCKNYYPQGRRIKITATPIPHAYFMKWNDNCPILGKPEDATNRVILTSSAECIAFFGNDSEPAAVNAAMDCEQNCELNTGESASEEYPEMYNRERYVQAFRFAEKAIMTVEEHLALNEMWPENFNDLENWFDPMPENLYVKKVQVKSGINEIGNDEIGNGESGRTDKSYEVDGQYIQIDVLLLNNKEPPEEELVPILVYYDNEGPIITEITSPENISEGVVSQPNDSNLRSSKKGKRWRHYFRRVIRYYRRWRWHW